MTISRTLRQFRNFTALVVIFQLLLAQVMVSSAELHHHCHDHSHEPEHQCEVTLILQGGIDRVLPGIVPVDGRAEPPQTPILQAVAIEAEPAHGLGGVLADAPPRGP
jgi:hypothetical protein